MILRSFVLPRIIFCSAVFMMSLLWKSVAWTASKHIHLSSTTKRIRFFRPSIAKNQQESSSYSSLTSSSGCSCRTVDQDSGLHPRNNTNEEEEQPFTPWNHPNLSLRASSPRSFRSRQHVNPLASKFQQPTILQEDWPQTVFHDLQRPLFLDIGCSRGGFLLDLATQRPDDYNYLGLEIRPIIVHQAQDRVKKRPHLHGHIDFVGCNANVDLDRLLTRLSQATTTTTTTTTITTTANQDDDVSSDRNSTPRCKNLQMVCIQFPDPHFKARHAKRRVVTPELVTSLARFMPPASRVFLQSDVQSVLDEMRLQFRQQSEYFRDARESVEEYIPENIVGIPTEREVSVLEQNLPVYRALFTRTEQEHSKEEAEEEGG